MLHAKKITLLNPAYWDDKNDSFFMEEYRKYKQSKSVLALCFSQCSATYHHWKIFANGIDGVLVEFSKEPLVNMLKSQDGVVIGTVEYKTIKEVNETCYIHQDRLPFIKRHAFKDEGEFRVVYTNQKERMDFKNFDIKLCWIRRIVLSPWMPEMLLRSVKNSLQRETGSENIKIIKSTLIKSEQWRQLASKTL